MSHHPKQSSSIDTPTATLSRLNILKSGAKQRENGSDKTTVPLPTIHPSNSQMSLSTVTFDLTRLGEEAFDVETYVRNMLQKLPNEDAVQQLHLNLADSKDSVSQELQRNVYRNYNEFVVISKEITKLEGDMIAVRRVLLELKEVRENFGTYVIDDLVIPKEEEEDEPKADEAFRLKVRSEKEAEDRQVAMKGFYRDIDGLSKALPELSNRELIHDGSPLRIWDINPNTYKQKDLVFIHVLSDAVVVTTWKKNMISGKNRLVLDRVFPINEIGFIDMKDSPEMMSAFKILKGSETFLYRAETLQEKRTLLLVITKITNEIVAKKKLELNLSKSPTSAVSPYAASPYSNTATSPLITKVGTKKLYQDGLSDTDYRWLLELSDELDVLIAQRDFGQAITAVERARLIIAACTGETPRLNILRTNIDERVTKLARLVSLDLKSPAATKNQIQEDIKRLLRLGLGDQARDIYLTARSSTIKHRLRQLQFNGDIVSYMIDYSEVFFRLIKNTCDWFGVSFHDASMASGFMKWIHQEIMKFAVIFRKQTFDLDHEFSVIAECVITAIERCQELNSVGMDLSSSFEVMIRKDLKKAIETHTEQCDGRIFKSAASDDFIVLPPNKELFASSNVTFEIPIPAMSRSGTEFYEVLSKFGSDVGILISFELYNTIVTALGQFFQTYVMGMKIAIEQKLKVSEYLVILTNTAFIVDHIFPTTKAQVTDRFNRTIPELEREKIELQQSLSEIRTSCLEQIQTRLITVDYNFEKVDYSNSGQILDTIMPGDEMLALVYSLRIVLKEKSVVKGHDLVQSLLAQLFKAMDVSPLAWSTPKGPRKFGVGGIQAFIMDIHFLLCVFEKQITEEIHTLSNSLCERALRQYFGQNKNLNTTLKASEFYNGRVKAVCKQLGF